MIVMWLSCPTPITEALVRNPGEAKFILPYCNKIGMQKRWGGGSRGYVMVTLDESCRAGEIAGVETVKLLCVGRRLTIVVNIFYSLCGDLLEVGSLAKWSWIFG